MREDEAYRTQRQLKAIKTHGKRHSSLVTGNYWGIFPEPPLEPVTTTAAKRREAKVPAMVENMTISIDLEAKDVEASTAFLDKLKTLVGLGKINRDFEVLATAEKLIRALGKAKFKNVVTVELDGEELYHHPEEAYDIDAAIERIIEEIGSVQGKGDEVFLKLASDEHKNCEVEATVKRVHMTWTHDILVKFHGHMPEEYFRRVINYLEEHLEIEDIVKQWTAIWE